MPTIYRSTDSEMTTTPAYPLVRLYAHVDIPDGKRRGEVVMQGNLPDQTVASKARYGMYPWPIGNECLSRVFRTTKVVDGKVVHSEPINGCPSCRANPSEEQKKDRSELDALKERIFELESKLEAATKPNFHKCPECDVEYETLQGLRVHTGRAHKKDKK